MRAIHDQAQLVDLVDDAAPERRQPGIVAMAAAGEVVVAVVGKVDLPHPEVAIEPQHREVALEHGGALEVEGNRQLAVAFGLPHLGNAAGQHEVVVMLGDPLAEPGDHPHHLADRVEIHPDIDRDVVGAGRAVALQRRHALLRQQGQAGMRVPH